MRQGTRCFGQNDRKGDESKRLPKLGNFVPNEEGNQGRACCSEETAQSSLLSVITMRGEPGGEIKHSAENWQGQQSDVHMRVFRSFEMQVNCDGLEKCEEAEQRILHLQMPRFERAPDGSERKHKRSERDRGPILREQSPCRGGCRDRTEIGMDGEQTTIQ